MESEVVTARFTSARDVTVVSEDGGQCAVFTAGVTRAIPKRLFTAAITAGLIPEKEIEIPPVVEEPANETQEETVAKGLLQACKTLILRGLADDFTTVGQPRVPAVKKLVDFDFTNKDMKEAFALAMHEVEQDGNDSEEHPEPSSGAAE